MKWEGNCNSHGFSEAKESIRIYSGLFLYMLAWSNFGVKYKSTCMYHICSFFLYYNWIFKSTVIRKIKCFICISCFFHVFFLFIFFYQKLLFKLLFLVFIIRDRWFLMLLIINVHFDSILYHIFFSTMRSAF